MTEGLEGKADMNHHGAASLAELDNIIVPRTKWPGGEQPALMPRHAASRGLPPVLVQ